MFTKYKRLAQGSGLSLVPRRLATRALRRAARGVTAGRAQQRSPGRIAHSLKAKMATVASVMAIHRRQCKRMSNAGG